MPIYSRNYLVFNGLHIITYIIFWQKNNYICQILYLIFICCDDKRQILFLSPTHSGRRHDKKLLDKSQFIESLPPDITIWADTGFVGLHHQHCNTKIPQKRRKGQILSDEQKANNKIISTFRIVVEHAIGGCKRYKAAADIYRNKRENLDDLFHLLSAGLWSFHLQNA